MKNNIENNMEKNAKYFGSSAQTILNFFNNANYKCEDFIVTSSNKMAWEIINMWPKWPSNILVISGDTMCGKTYLSNIWQQLSDAEELNLSNINIADIDGSKNYILSDITNNSAIVFDEDKIFHLYNHINEHDGYLLITSLFSPNDILFSLKDLSSRLKSVTSIAINAPDDLLMKALLTKSFIDRQLNVSSDVIDYVVPRIERSYIAIYNLVQEIDTRSMQDKSPITIPFVRNLLLKN